MSSNPDVSAKQGLNCLALDGGGVRGLASLIILQRLMHLIDPAKPPKPCDVFDMIAGTSTGGLIAIMLGRLRMDVASCIEAYIDMSKDVFSPRWRTKILGRTFHNIMGNATFDYRVLEDKIRGMVQDRLGDADAALLEERPRCKMFVCASMSNTETQRLRSYRSRAEEAFNCRIWQAARATSAAPTFFDPITFSNGCKFRDGALRDNNPIFELIDEVRIEFPDREVSCIVSIGTGVPASILVRNGLTSVAKACAKIAVDTQNVAQRFEEVYCSRGATYRGKYFRYNISKGLEDVRLDEWEKGDIMMSNTKSYLRKEAEALKVCARRLRRNQIKSSRVTVAPKRQGGSNDSMASRSPSMLTTTSGPNIEPGSTPNDQIGLLEPEPLRPSSYAPCSQIPPGQLRGQRTGIEEEVTTSTANISLTRNQSHGWQSHLDDFYQLDRIGKQPVPHFAMRPELDQIKSLLLKNSQDIDVRIISLLGLGGAGKTQLMLQYASSERGQYGVVLWIDATSIGSITSTYEIAASLLGLVAPPFEQAVPTSSSLIRYSSKLDTNIAAVKRELVRRGRPWLILLDGADDLNTIRDLRNYIPSAPNGHVLISSRRKQARVIGNHSLKVEGLPINSARSLLLFKACIEDPSDSNIKCAEKIVCCLDCIALAVELAGSYIETLGCLESYLDLYNSSLKEELLMRSIGNNPPQVSDYKMSVLTAWRLSIAAIPEKTANLLYLLCFLDRTNISKDMLRRACAVKPYWNSDGQLDELHPTTSGIPQWLLYLFCDEHGQWSEFQYHEAVFQLSSFFFVEKEVVVGGWRHHSGTVDARSLTSHEEIPELLKIPQSVHDVGKLYQIGPQRQVFCQYAFSVVIHSFWNDVPTGFLPGASSVAMYVSQGGMATTVADLTRHLEEAYGHILILQHALRSNVRGQFRCFDSQIQLWKRAETIMFATSFWTVLLEHDQEMQKGAPGYRGTKISRQGDGIYAHKTPWETILEVADILLEPTRSQWTPRTSGTWTSSGQHDFRHQSGSRLPTLWGGDQDDDDLHYPQNAFLNVEVDFEQKWARRQSYYWERICRSRLLTRGDLKVFVSSIYRVMALAEAELACRPPSYDQILQRMIEWCRVESGLGGHILETWVESEAGRYFRKRLPIIEPNVEYNSGDY
ncbi:hypothetical protein F4804DRAFT_305284 [Jackrogersella minutella]|nr:hypothetical protein F4804DRAFT_305284 [Jackrogersella minutella]